MDEETATAPRLAFSLGRGWQPSPILYVAEHDLGNTVSNSYEQDLDLIAGPDEQTSWDDTLEVATA